MKRVIIFVSVVIVLLASGLMVLPYIVSSQSIKVQLSERIHEFTDSQISYKGEPVLSFNPYLGVELNDVAFAGEKQSEEEPDLLRVEKLQFSLKVLPLLFGKTRFRDFKLIRPRLNLLVRDNGSANWDNWTKIGTQIDGGQMVAQVGSQDENELVNPTKPAPASFADIKLGQFEIFDGIIETSVGGLDSAFRVSNLHANVDWPSLFSSWNVAGKGVWRGEAFVFSNETENPWALLTTGKSGLKATFESPALVSSFEGQAIMLTDIQLQGEASIATPSMPRLLELLQDDGSIEKLPFGNYFIQGLISANASEIRFDEAKIELGTNVGTGNLQLHWNEDNKPKVSGTLAFTSLDVTPVIEVVMNREPKSSASGSGTLAQHLFDLDVRFSAQNYKFRKKDFGRLAATAMFSNNEWSFDIGEADFFDGMIIANIASKIVDDAEEIELKGILRNVSMGKIARDWYGGKIVTTGNADVNFDLKAPGKTTLGNFRDFFGNMKVSLTDGRIEGVDLVKAIPALTKNNGFVTIDEIKGVTPFTNLSLDVLINNGVGWITKGNAKGELNEFHLAGKTDLLSGGLAIYADISQIVTGEKLPQRTQMFIGGTIENPLVTRSPLAKRPAQATGEEDGEEDG